MPRGIPKLIKYDEINQFENVFQYTPELRLVPSEMKGKWNELFFKNSNPIVIELGCGRGEYSIALAAKYPNLNFIGIDLKGSRIWKGAKIALRDNLHNVAFIRTRIDFIENLFEQNEVSEIWITFPDPYPTLGKAKKRLVSTYFLKKYINVLQKDGLIHFKTDNADLFDFGLEEIRLNNHQLLKYTHDLYSNDTIIPDDILSVKTYYESLFLAEGKSICYAEFKLNV